VKRIGAAAFSDCKNLEKIKIKSTKLKWVGEVAFRGIKSSAQIKVPSKKLAAYKKLLEGNTQAEIVEISK
jgi:hypothetical protein